MKKQIELLSELTISDLKKMSRYPDKHYKVPDSAVWIYIPGHIYWWDYKKEVIKDNSKAIIKFKDVYKFAQKAGHYQGYDDEYVTDDWFSGDVTHKDLAYTLQGKGIKVAFPGTKQNIYGRSSRGDHQAWLNYDDEKYRRLWDKAIAAAYKHIK